MNIKLKRALYESIMKSVSKLVKKVLNEEKVDNRVHFNSKTGIARITTDAADENLRTLNDYLDSIKPFKELKVKDEERLIDLILNSKNPNTVQTAKDILINANLRFVVTVAKRYANAKKVTFEDLIQAGNEGLIEAVNHIIPEKVKNIRFTSFAVWYIRRHIMAFLDDFGYTNTLPFEIGVIVRAVAKFKELFYNKNERNPEFDEILDGLKKKMPNLTAEKLQSALEAGSFSDDGLDDVVYTDEEGNELTKGDYTENTTYAAPDKNLDDEDLKRELEEVVLNVLGERDGNVFLNKFGINGRREMLTWEIAKNLGMTETNVNVIIRNGKEKLLKNPDARALLRYI